MDFEKIDSLRKLIDYLHDDEKKHWEENGHPNDHIYLDVLRMLAYLNQED